jgi:uncharacterized protein YaaQ
MKLVIAVVHDEDSHKLMDLLSEAKFGVTMLASTGGFLRTGNTTLMIGTEKDRVDEAMKIIKENCKSRKKIASNVSPAVLGTGVYMPYPVEVCVGGATIFVIDVEQFEKA